MTGGKPDMQALLQRLQAGVPRTGTTSVTYIIFDILERDGKPLTGLPLFSGESSWRRRCRKVPMSSSPNPLRAGARTITGPR